MLSLLAYGLTVAMWWFVDDNPCAEYANDSGWPVFVLVDFLFCTLFMFVSQLYTQALFRFIPLENLSYKHLVFYACLLFLFNNLLAFVMTEARNLFWPDPQWELWYMQDVYVNGMIVTFISGIYACAVYLESYRRANEEKNRLERALMKEKEVALRSQLQSLKAQIDPHFLFNNFSILSELIEDDPPMVQRFLTSLSRVYRYIIQNLERTVIPVAEEIVFLDSYL